MPSDPKVSIITVSLNAAETIAKTIQSISNQTYENIEYIVIDGCSDDGTRTILDSNKDHISTLVIEPDTGIYNAMNKGISHSTGDFVMFINADDYLFSENTIQQIVDKYSEDPNHDVYVGHLLLVDSSGSASIWAPPQFSALNMWRTTLPHPSTIYRKRIFDEVGAYDESYKIAGDYEHFLRLLKSNTVLKPINTLVSVFSLDGISNNPSLAEKTQNERDRAKLENFQKNERRYLRFRTRFRKIFGI